MICKHKSVKWFQVLLCITNNSMKHPSFVYTQLNNQTVIFLTIQFSISHLFAHSLNVKQLYLTHRRNLSGATSSGQSGHGSNGNEGVLHISQRSRITGASSSHGLVSYPGNSLGCLTSLQRCIWFILLPQLTWLKTVWNCIIKIFP